MLSRYNLRSKSKQPQQDEDNLILSLPQEILELILNYIPQKETINLRLVCKAWNQDVETLYNYNVESLKDNSPHFQRVLEHRIKKLSIESLTETSVLNAQGISIFKHPKQIKVLKIEPCSSVSPRNLQQLLRLCAETVRSVYLNLSPDKLNYEFELDEVFKGYKFTNLKHLQIESNGFSKTVQENSKSLFQVLENSQMQQLKGLRIDLFITYTFTMETRVRIGENILRILSRHGINLEKLDLDIRSSRMDDLEIKQLTSSLEKEELDQIKKMDRVQEFHVAFKPFALQLQDFWQQFLANQKELVKLEIRWHFPGGPISIPLFRQIVMNNSLTLVEIEMWELNLFADDLPFDFSGFQACQNLQILCLYRTNVTRTDPDQPDVIEFHRLPESITELTLRRLNILTEELLIGFTQGFKNLQKLNLDECGMHGLLGVNWPILSAILSRPSLTKVNLFHSVFCEDESLEIELGGLDLSLSDLCDLHREPGSLGWSRPEYE